MLVLGIDSAASGCFVCLWQDGVVVAVKSEKMSRGQDSRLMPIVLDVMRDAGASFSQLDRVVVIKGPGSFTGLRIGVSAARGIGLAAEKPVLGVDRFAVYQKQHFGKRGNKSSLLVAIDSRRKELFCQFCSANGDVSEPDIMSAEEITAFCLDKLKIGPLSLAGDAADILRPYLPEGVVIASLVEEEVVTAASIAAAADVSDSEFSPRPLYIRPPDVTVGASK
ncbi:MAG: tRNA (adenosine(37)-N6)-threonylcarbamoyltransferase complex dimerization subunit type 1 TsaB [Alphaproteobacteria bacterium]|nr:tRNA (adenosine(37)-N6)-threonylcarbamoyltransferase complex dimerization subunit type 1 TsaB [Alphaproteobacteria bacterium]